ncbi:MAG: alpha-1,4-glucan--maltose-1-phosphate maltosyltransferase [Nitriliruptorales bacterium]|nr:alpha-1,4-glucan--maltose-1-phosphate maltosyltransferase [Nitriliruptorales bacterium]
MTVTQRRVSIRHVRPQVDCGRFPAKASVGEAVDVEADIFADSHDLIAAVALWREAGDSDWTEAPMELIANDRWRGTVTPDEPGRYEFTVRAWIDRFATWQRDMAKRIEAGVATEVDYRIGADLVGEALDVVSDPAEKATLSDAREILLEERPSDRRAETALSPEVAGLVSRHDERRFATTFDRTLELRVDRARARFSSWYELFPRSAAAAPGRHGTFDDVIARLPYVASMGFDVLYLPPIHPIGQTHRKGPNNVTEAGPDDPGSPWAIGSSEGGHKSIHPELGDLDDFQRLISAAGDHGLEVALDIAFQCAPDHPWVEEHPEWFKQRPDGSIQYAENPPKKYQDIYPLNFETEDPEGLWEELKSVFDHWIDQGIRIFRVDNPHTKSFPFWEWCIDEITREHPDVIFLSEAFTRPKVMYELAKVGFTQSYTYFAWRNRKWEIEQYYNELHRTEVTDFFRPNSWPNTPDILTEFLQYGGRPAFVQKLILAATLTANYGIYGPPFELMLNEARPGAEEYIDNEKYEIHHWNLDQPHSLREMIARVNRIRHENPALQQDREFTFHHVDNEELMIFSKATRDRSNVVLVVVNLDPNWKQSGTTWLDMEALGLDPDSQFQVHDRIGESRYLWHGPDNYVELDPHVTPGHIFVVRDIHHTERDFPTF